MNLSCETVMDFYAHKNGKVFCQIRVSPKSKSKNTCRCLTHKQWLIFDKELENLLNEKDYWSDEKSSKFNIDSNIEVKVQKSKLSLKYFLKCLGIIGGYNISDADGVKNVMVLEFLITFQLEETLNSSIKSQEYEPQIKTTPDGKLCSPVIYEPYTPSKNIKMDKVDIKKNSDIGIFETYTPKPLFEIGKVEPLSAETIPKYTPAPITANCRSRGKYKFNNSTFLNDVITERHKSKDKHNSVRKNFNKTSKRLQTEYIPTSRKDAIVNVPIYIPTPIEETTALNVYKSDNIRSNKKRSNTIDVFPKQLDENTKDKQTSNNIEEQLNYRSQCYNQKFKKRSMTIDEIPAVLANVPDYISTPVGDTTNENILKPCNYKKNKRFYTLDTKEEPISSKGRIKEMHEMLEKSSVNVYENPVALTKVKEKITSRKKRNEKNGKYYRATSSKIQIIESANKLNCVNKQLTDTATEKDERDGKSLRRSDRSHNKPKRLIEEQPNLHNNRTISKKHKLSPKNKELFGTDEDDDDDCFVNNNNQNSNNNNSSNKVISPPFDTLLHKKITQNN